MFCRRSYIVNSEHSKKENAESLTLASSWSASQVNRSRQLAGLWQDWKWTTIPCSPDQSRSHLIPKSCPGGEIKGRDFQIKALSLLGRPKRMWYENSIANSQNSDGRSTLKSCWISGSHTLRIKTPVGRIKEEILYTFLNHFAFIPPS